MNKDLPPVCNLVLSSRKSLGYEPNDTPTGFVTWTCQEQCNGMTEKCRQDLIEISDWQLDKRREKETMSDADIKVIQRESETFLYNIDNVLLHGRTKKYREAILNTLRGVVDGGIDNMLK